jgi:hypothetical protein
LSKWTPELQRPLRDGLRVRAVLGMHERQPGLLPAVELTGRKAVDRALVLVPDGPARGRIPVPHARCRGLEGEFEPLAAFLQLERALGHLELEVRRLLLHPGEKLAARGLGLVAVPVYVRHPAKQHRDEAQERHGVGRGEIDGLVAHPLPEASEPPGLEREKDGGDEEPDHEEPPGDAPDRPVGPEVPEDAGVQARDRERAAEGQQEQGAGRRHPDGVSVLEHELVAEEDVQGDAGDGQA